MPTFSKTLHHCSKVTVWDIESRPKRVHSGLAGWQSAPFCQDVEVSIVNIGFGNGVMLSFELQKMVADSEPLLYREDVLISHIYCVHQFKTYNISMYTKRILLNKICVKIIFQTMNGKNCKLIRPNTSAQNYDLSTMEVSNKRICVGFVLLLGNMHIFM